VPFSNPWLQKGTWTIHMFSDAFQPTMYQFP